MTRLHKLGSSLRDLRTVVGMVPALLAVFNNAIFAIIPLTPLLRPRATFLVILTALISFAMTHNYASNRVKKRPDVVGLLRLALAFGLLGLLLLGVYGVSLTYIQVHPPSDPVFDALIDWLQIVFFTAPFVCWTVCLGALGHEASHWMEPRRRIPRRVHKSSPGLHPHNV